MGCGGFAATHRLYGFPLWGKLSPKVTDEGVTCGNAKIAGKPPVWLPPLGEAVTVGD